MSLKNNNNNNKQISEVNDLLSVCYDQAVGKEGTVGGGCSSVVGCVLSRSKAHF